MYGGIFHELFDVHCPKIEADFREYRGGIPLEGEFSGNSRKEGIISSDYWEIFPPEDFPPQTIGNLLCFRDSLATKDELQ